MNDRFVLAAAVIIGVPATLILYIAAMERLVQHMPGRRQTGLRPWLWLAPAVLFLTLFLVYPVMNTLWLSFFGPDSREFVGLRNYTYVFTDGAMLEALRNNAVWLLLFTLLTVRPAPLRLPGGCTSRSCGASARRSFRASNHMPGWSSNPATTSP